LIEILQDKFQVHNGRGQQSIFVSTLQGQVAQLLSEPPLHEQQQQDNDGQKPGSSNCSSNSADTLRDERQQRRRLYETLERSFRLGKDLRWFGRVFTLALALYRFDCRNVIATSSDSSTKETCYNENDGIVKIIKRSVMELLPVFQPHYLLEALVDMGASFLTPSGEPDLLAAHSQDKPDNINTHDISGSVMAEPRMQALHDLCGPQIVLVLAAKRILTRDVQYSTTATFPSPLTFQRLWQEYNTTYRGNTNRYGRSLVYKAFHDLLSMGLLRPAMDHTGTVPLQYDYHGELSSLSPSSLTMLPLHFNIDIYREMQKAMDGNLLDCPAALREWGKKTH
jgi:Origin recognition complex (ORC) subunit 4 C-terminus